MEKKVRKFKKNTSVAKSPAKTAQKKVAESKVLELNFWNTKAKKAVVKSIKSLKAFKFSINEQEKLN